jgi:hypothetical protein
VKLGCCYPAVKKNNKKSCNKNAMKNTEMLEKYIYILHANQKNNKSVLIS